MPPIRFAALHLIHYLDPHSTV